MTKRQLAGVIRRVAAQSERVSIARAKQPDRMDLLLIQKALKGSLADMAAALNTYGVH